MRGRGWGGASGPRSPTLERLRVAQDGGDRGENRRGRARNEAGLRRGAGAGRQAELRW